MRFVDFLRATVLLSAGSATSLAVLTLLAATRDQDERAALVACGWWLVATLIGAFVGRRNEVNPPISRLLAEARAATVMPPIRPAATLLNRLWPLLLAVLLAGAATIVGPQVPGIAAGFTIIWALAWRRQESAVRAIEERDGVTFYVERTSPVRAIRLVRTAGFRRERASVNGTGP
jgi:hypothetical protein